MKKVLALMLALIMAVSLASCGGGKNNTSATEVKTKATKEELLKKATPIKEKELDKAIGNMPYAKSLKGKIYTFDGYVKSIEDKYAVITFTIEYEDEGWNTSEETLVGNIYLPTEDLINNIEIDQKLSFVGEISKVKTHKTSDSIGEHSVVDLVFENAFIVSDRFEDTGKLFSRNTEFGKNAWNVEMPDSDYMMLVKFREDVGDYYHKKITFSYKYIDDEDEGAYDAYIVKKK